MRLHVVKSLFVAALITASSAMPIGAHAATLDFSGNICGVAGNQACGNGSQIGQSYGDIAGQLDISYRSRLTR